MTYRSLLDLSSGDRLAGGTSYFEDTATSNKTVADLLVMNGNYTEDGLAKAVATRLADIVNDERMPAVGATGTPYRYTYSGNIAAVKVENLTGNASVTLLALALLRLQLRLLTFK